jgi:2-polyprenyl-3-methyl-5-hydroxy-6-metoxy-1,4-benzoquinol methylase
MTAFIPCDICGDPNPKLILQSRRLDGPLVECSNCGLRYVGERRSGLAYGTASATQITERVKHANAAFRNLPPEEEKVLAVKNSFERLSLVRQFRPSGKLLEIGCGRGDFLEVAREYFTAFGVEPNPELAKVAGEIAPVHQGTIDDMPWGHYDIAVSFHVIEHVDSPKRFLMSISDQLRAGGLLVLETPDIDSIPYRFMKGKWRQLIPEHYYFFDEESMKKLFGATGFKVLKIGRVGKFANSTLVLNRLSRYFSPFGYLETLSRKLGLSSFYFEMDPMDIMIAVAVKNDPDSKTDQTPAAS